MRRNRPSRKGHHPPYPALPSYPYWDAGKQVARFCAGEDEAHEYAAYLNQMNVKAVAIVPSEWPKQECPVVVCEPINLYSKTQGGPSYTDESNCYEAFKCFEMMGRATDQHRNLAAILERHEKEKNGILKEQILAQLGACALPGIEVGLQHHVGYHYRLLKKGEISQRDWDEEVTKLILDGKMQQPAAQAHWKPKVLLWEGNEECASAPSIRFNPKLWTVSHIDNRYQLFLGGHPLPGVKTLARSQALDLAEAYEKILSPPEGVTKLIDTLIGSRIRLEGFGGEEDCCGRIAAITDDTVGVDLEGRAYEDLGILTFSRYNGREVAHPGASSGKKITERILKKLDEQFPKDIYEQKTSTEHPRKRRLARLAEMHSAQEWFDSTPGVEAVIDLDDMIGAPGLDDLNDMIGVVKVDDLDDMIGVPR